MGTRWPHYYRQHRLTANQFSYAHWIREIVYDIRRGVNYNTNNVPIVRTQLAKGAFRLAKLLDAIFANQ